MPTPPKKPMTKLSAKPATTTPSKPAATTGMAALHKAEDRVKETVDDAARATQNAGTAAAKNANDMMAAGKTATDTVVSLGTNAARNAAEAGTAQVERLQSDTRRFAGQAVEGLQKQAQKGSEAIGEMSTLAQRQMEAVAQCGNIAASMTKDVSEDLFLYANEYFSNQVQISKDIFTCRTINDVFELQNKVMKANLDGFFSETAKLSEMMFNYMNRAAESLTECMQEASDRFTKNLAA